MGSIEGSVAKVGGLAWLIAEQQRLRDELSVWAERLHRAKVALDAHLTEMGAVLKPGESGTEAGSPYNTFGSRRRFYRRPAGCNVVVSEEGFEVTETLRSDSGEERTRTHRQHTYLTERPNGSVDVHAREDHGPQVVLEQGEQPPDRVWNRELRYQRPPACSSDSVTDRNLIRLDELETEYRYCRRRYGERRTVFEAVRIRIFGQTGMDQARRAVKQETDRLHREVAPLVVIWNGELTDDARTNVQDAIERGWRRVHGDLMREPTVENAARVLVHEASTQLWDEHSEREERDRVRAQVAEKASKIVHAEIDKNVARLRELIDRTKKEPNNADVFDELEKHYHAYLDLVSFGQKSSFAERVLEITPQRIASVLALRPTP